MLADAEAELRTARPIAECVTPGVVLGGDADATVGDCIVVTERVVQQVFPTKEELPLLSHVRRVDLSDTPAFGRKTLTLTPDLAGRTWARFEVWDVTTDGAFTQPVWIEPRPGK